MARLDERWFEALTDRRVRRGVSISVKHLIAEIVDWVDRWNTIRPPFVWYATVEDMLKKVLRARITPS